MKIHCIFKQYPDEAIELMDAWDEFTVEENPEGYVSCLEEFINNPEKHQVIEVIVHVSYNDVVNAFKAVEVEGKVEPCSR